ncbi:MAG: hypothetical protein WCZ72_06065 [Gemmobacter sp.]
MSNSDSFFNEVAEEVRRERLFRLFRRYGWIGAVLVALIVAGAAWNEWQKARDRAAAQAFGDAVLTALDAPDSAARAAALAALDVPAGSDEATALVALMIAGEAAGGDPAARAAALAALGPVAADESLAPRYRDLAILQRALLDDGADPAARRAALEPLTAQGRPYRSVVQEQLALLALSEGDTDTARNLFAALQDDPEAPQGLRQRAAQLIVVLGGMPAS